jgi:acyl-CoA thioesterase FadM
MMLLVRMLLVWWRGRFRGRLGPLDESVITLRVLPNDIDMNLHLNNGRYLTIMDLGRLDFIARTGMLRPMVRERWAPLVGSASIRFVRSIDALRRYQLRTRLMCWDDKWFYFEQRFERNGELVAIGWVKGLLRGRNGNLRPAEILALAGLSTESPPMPAGIAQWQAALRAADAGAGGTKSAERNAG